MMTDEDKERIIQERKRQERLAFEAQDRCCHISSILRKLGLMNAIDRAIYEEAKRRLDESREERKLMSELGHMVKLFEEYFKRKESRLPEGLDTLIARNNLACVMVEIYGVDHPLCERKCLSPAGVDR